jgi:hypothetical protein
MKNTDMALIVLVAFSIVVSVSGFIWSASVLDKMPSNKLTAYGTAGYVNVTITTLTSINVTATNCNFGAGYITVGQTNATLESNGTISNWQGVGTSESIVVRNDGNKNLTINVSSGKDIPTFYGADCSGAGQGCVYNFWSADNESGSCTAGLVTWPGTPMNTSNRTACSNLRYEDSIDEIKIICRLGVYQTVPTGAKTDMWTFWAIEN